MCFSSLCLVFYFYYISILVNPLNSSMGNFLEFRLLLVCLRPLILLHNSLCKGLLFVKVRLTNKVQILVMHCYFLVHFKISKTIVIICLRLLLDNL